MKFQVTTAAFAFAAAASLQAAALPAPSMEPRNAEVADEGAAAPLEARLLSWSPHNTASNPDLSTKVHESSSSWTHATSKTNEFGNGNYVGPVGCGRRSLAYRRAFRARDGYTGGNGGYNGSGNGGYNGSGNTTDKSRHQDNSVHEDDHTDNSIKSHSGNTVHANITSSGNTITGSPGAANVVNCGSTSAKRDEMEHAEGLAILRSLGAMTSRGVDDPLEILAARDIAYSAAQLGVRAYDDAGYDGLARRSSGDFALDCMGGAHCQEHMRREAEELLIAHARDLGFHF